ncbi:metal ABC transporter solute-binding protein, Zn/Mn family [Azonexus sp.]|jgi:zinc/manganese transport system substrate-binding protein|uniref:metal ABC transporter substrate-binding protein n=1 Tax=Azonexus sp. TaxID=1872668 RepID=UPI0028184790|nr:zinc ABC transporter substrate-binding protein [Azonexus sp.]MDR1994220.1 zinc ABC transporter substrate-binding protein [Azonexus sp.]
MKKILLLCLLVVAPLLARADLRVFATVPEWGALVKEIGGPHVSVYTATHALQDPHRIEARPSLLAQARRADLLVATGADLEAGWLPLVQRDSGNAAIQSGRPGYFEAAAVVRLRDVPAVLDRAQGDIHAAGNPHLHLDPYNVLKVGEALAARLGELDPAQAADYQAGFRAFAERWQAAIGRWEKLAAPLRGVPVLVHHQSFVYLTHWLGMREVGMLEPKPGIEPTSGHLTALLARLQAQPARMVLVAAYNRDGPSQWIASRSGLPVVLLPYTVGGTPAAGDLFALYDDTLQRLLRALR